jgi:predicted ATP-grasp superfamily ATP-dependent carboligase
MLGLLTTPHDVTRPQILMLYYQEVGSLGDILGHHLLQELLSEYIAKISLLLTSLYKLNFQIV